jgi:cell division protein FtsN
MPRNDEGEFELILGNKQLLSVFFIVVVLLAVFFTSGYIVGRSTAGAQMAAAPERPIVVEPDVEGGVSPPPETASARPAPASEPPPAPVEQPKRAAAPPPARPKPAPKPVVPPRTGEPAAGSVYLQVAATTLPEAEVLLGVLQKRGFSGRLAPVPGQDLYRVLIGAIEGPDDLSQTRTKLQEAGFQPFTRRY